MKTIYAFVIAFLIIGFFFLAMPEKGYSGTGMMIPVGVSCCQLRTADDVLACVTLEPLQLCAATEETSILDIFEGETCNDETGLCSGFVPPIESRNVPTLSEWGLIAMAGILGLVAFVFVRKRKVTA